MKPVPGLETVAAEERPEEENVFPSIVRASLLMSCWSDVTAPATLDHEATEMTEEAPRRNAGIDLDS